jgi:hypothetical protein
MGLAVGSGCGVSWTGATVMVLTGVLSKATVSGTPVEVVESWKNVQLVKINIVTIQRIQCMVTDIKL